jgi:hypothetical protein
MKTNSDYLVDAIKLLKPYSEFSFQGSDYSTIKWDVLEGDAPTQAEINKAIEQVKVDEIAEAQTKASKRAELLNRLGITEEEARILLG